MELMPLYFPFFVPDIIDFIKTDSSLSLWLSLCAGPSVRQSGSPSVRQSVSPSVHQSVSPSVRQSVSPSVRQSVISAFSGSRLVY